MIVHRRFQVRIVATTPLCPDLQSRCAPLVWFACSVNGDIPLHVVVYREPNGALELMIPPPPINEDWPEIVFKDVKTKVRRHIRRMARGET